MKDLISCDPITSSHADAYQGLGYVVMCGLLSERDAERCAVSVLDILRTRAMEDSCLAQTGEYLAGTAIDGLINSKRLRSLCSQLMGGDGRLYLPFSAVKGPGQGAFKFHQDNQYTCLDGPACNAWFALRPCTVKNGCLRMVPRSHLEGTLPSKEMFDDGSHRTVCEEPEHWDDIELAAGDCVVFDRLTVHASGPNESDDHRVSYAVQFHRNDVRWFDAEANAWKWLVDEPRWSTAPVAELSQVTIS